jgi:hypothetical protein
MNNTTFQPHIISKGHPQDGSFDIHSAAFTFYVASLQKIENEFYVKRSNEKGRTILTGCQNVADMNVAKLLQGRTFLIDRAGRDLPLALGKFSKDFMGIVNAMQPSPDNERHEENLTGDIFEATKFKIALKKILRHLRLIYTNESDDNLMLVRVDTDQSAGEGLIEALFRAGGEDRDIYISFTETTDFKLTES